MKRKPFIPPQYAAASVRSPLFLLRHRSRRRCTHGLTLAEVLLSVAIVMVLAGLLWPALSHVRSSGATTRCLAQMRNLQQAHWAYMNDNRGWFVDVGMPHGGMQNPPDHEDKPWWFFTLQSYYDNQLVLKSPADTSPHWPTSLGGRGIPVPGSNNGFRWSSYGVNDFLTSLNPEYAWTGDPSDLYMRISRIRNPANTVHFAMIAFEGTNAGSDHIHPEAWMSHPKPEQRAADFMETGAHGGKSRSFGAISNYGFLDGSAGTHRFQDVFLDADRNRFNPRTAATFGVTSQQ